MGDNVQTSDMPPSEMHHTVVALETFFCPIPPLALPSPHTYTLHSYDRTLPSEIAPRIADADILLTTTIRLDDHVLSAAVSPRLRIIVVMAAGTDSVDKEACRRRGILVTNTPGCNAGAVAEHAIALYFAVRRSIPLAQGLVRAGEWPRRGALMKVLDGPDGRPPRTSREEVVGLIGYGAIGKRIASMADALGMKVLISDRKDSNALIEGRTPFGTVLREASVLVLCLPRTPSTTNLVSEPEFAVMRPCAVLVNVSRGGIVDEASLVAALRRNSIAGAATDVYLQEPAGPKTTPLLAADAVHLNLVTTPHVAWCADETNANYQRVVKENLAAWLTGKPINVVT